MEHDLLFSYIAFPFYLIIFLVIYLYVKQNITKYGFNNINIFILTFTLFYLLVPFVQTYFKNDRDDTTHFTMILNLVSDDVLFYNFLISFSCLLIIVITYHIKFRTSNKSSNTRKVNEPVRIYSERLYIKLNIITDLLFLISALSIFLLIWELGSIKKYLSFGSLTRGIDKDPTQYIRPSFLQLVTVSVIILVTPYLYLYLYKIKRSRFLLIKFLISFLLSVLYLLYNQGRAPLLLFFLPFIFTIIKRNKKALIALTILTFTAIVSLNYLDTLFKIIAFGNSSIERSTNFITLFLKEFSYPFTNFVFRNELVSISGYRYMVDFVIWPLTMIPNSLLQFVGFDKGFLISLTSINTSSYGIFIGQYPPGFIPVDFLTFNFYQLGYISLIFNCIIVGVILKYIDRMYYFFANNFAIKIILYRISFSIINILNNADISAIVRNRLDVVLLLLILIYIYKKSKNINIKGDYYVRKQ